MDGREGMTLQGSNNYYLHRGIQPGLNTQPLQGYNINPNFSPHPISRVGNSIAPQFNVEGHQYQSQSQSQANIPQGFTLTVPSSPGGSLSDPTKKKRGRPRKYGPDGSEPGGTSGSMSLGLLPSMPNSGTLVEKKKRGRPRGSGRKQRLASVGEWMNSSAGLAFTPHTIYISPGEDIAAKVLEFSQERPRALCVMSGWGCVSSVTLRQPASPTGTLTFEGPFKIVCLSGLYLVADSGGSRNRSGGVNVSLSSSHGVIGGAVDGRLIASEPVHVVVFSFVYGNNIKGKSNKESESKNEKGSEQPTSDKKTQQMNASSSQNMDGSWAGSRGMDPKNPNIDFDLGSG